MSLLLTLLDTIVKFGFVILFGLFFRSLVRGDFRLNPNHQYAEVESDIHIYIVWTAHDVEAIDYSEDIEDWAILCDAHAENELSKYRNVTCIEKHEPFPNARCQICKKSQ
jgi:hypothetical protein